MRKIVNILKSIYLQIRFPFLRKDTRAIPRYTWYDEIPIGWRKRFGLQLCKELKKALKKDKQPLNSLKFTNIQEKWGCLRIETPFEPSITELLHTSRVIYKYEYISRYVCINCGDDATLHSIGKLHSYCYKCFPTNKIFRYINDVYDMHDYSIEKQNKDLAEKEREERKSNTADSSFYTL